MNRLDQRSRRQEGNVSRNTPPEASSGLVDFPPLGLVRTPPRRPSFSISLDCPCFIPQRRFATRTRSERTRLRAHVRKSHPNRANWFHPNRDFPAKVHPTCLSILGSEIMFVRRATGYACRAVRRTRFGVGFPPRFRAQYRNPAHRPRRLTRNGHPGECTDVFKHHRVKFGRHQRLLRSAAPAVCRQLPAATHGFAVMILSRDSYETNATTGASSGIDDLRIG